MKLRNARAVVLGASAVCCMCLGMRAEAQEIVASFGPPDTDSPGIWYQVDVRPGGMASTEDLTGSGGNLEAEQPLPVGAAKLTTDSTNAAKAEVGVADGYGPAEDILPSLELHYSYHKATNEGQNLAAAPSIKLALSKLGCAEGVDCFGTLVYEPYLNQSGNPLLDTWVDVEIDGDNGIFWWTGGFGQANSAGGPPYRTLAEWLDVFSPSPDFAGAHLTLVSIGVGSVNPGQIGYFDEVEITHGFDGGYQAHYDFEPAVGPPADKDECKLGGWQDFNAPAFKNQGECVRFVVSEGKLKP
jgi:hypothetical protein